MVVCSYVPLLAALLAGLVITPAGGASTQPAISRVLVMPFAVEVDSATPGSASAALWLGEAAALLVTDGLLARGVPAFPRSERLAAFDQLDLPATSVLTRATMIRVAELIGATEVIFGDIRVGPTFEVRARTIQVSAGAEAPVVADRGVLEDLFPVFGRVTGALPVTGSAPVATEPAPPRTRDLEAFENYVKGLVATTPESQQRFLEAAMVRAPRDGAVLIELWRTYTALGAHEKALAVASAVPAGTLQARPARLAVALSLVELGRVDGALRELTTLSAQRPSALVANAHGVIELRRASDLPAAIGRFDEAVQLEPSNPDYRFNLGYAYARHGDRDRALTALREVVRIDAADPEAHVVMAVLLALAGRTAEARRERDLATSLGATAVDPAAGIPTGLERLPATLEVDFGPRPMQTEHPRQRTDERLTAEFHLGRARTLADARRDRDAIDALRRAIYLDPYADAPHLLLGLVFQRNGRLAEAVDEFRVALWARESVEAHVALGAALFETGDRDGARRSAERALQMNPASVEARELLNRIGGLRPTSAVLPSSPTHV